MTFLWEAADRQDDDESPPAGRAKRGTPLRSRRGLLLVVLGTSGWLLLTLTLLVTDAPPVGGSYLSLSIWLVAVAGSALISTAAILVACVKRSWGVALATLVLAAACVVVVARHSSNGNYIDYQYRTHRTGLAQLAAEYRAGRLDGDVTLPPDVRSLCPSGFAYASRTALFVQMWQNWRAESGTGLAYFAATPTPRTSITTAEGDTGTPQREVGDGWWWVA